MLTKFQCCKEKGQEVGVGLQKHPLLSEWLYAIL